MSIINFWDLIYHIIIDFKFILLKKKGSLNIDFNMGKMSIINFLGPNLSYNNRF